MLVLPQLAQLLESRAKPLFRSVTTPLCFFMKALNSNWSSMPGMGGSARKEDTSSEAAALARHSMNPGRFGGMVMASSCMQANKHTSTKDC